MNPRSQKLREEARHARRALEQVRKALLNPAPESLTACAPPLNNAIRCMERLQAGLLGANSGVQGAAPLLRIELSQLRRELLQVQTLLAGAAQFYEGYGRLLGSDREEPELNYAAAGPAKENPTGLRLTVHG